MAEINLVIHGKSYGIACDNGQEQRVADLGHYVDQRLREISSAGAATNESHLLVLTALVLADEIYEAKNTQKDGQTDGDVVPLKERVSESEELQIVEAIEHMAARITSVSGRLQKTGS